MNASGFTNYIYPVAIGEENSTAPEAEITVILWRYYSRSEISNMVYEEWDEIYKNNKLKEFKNFGVKSKLPDEIKSNRTIYYAYKREYNKIWKIYDRNMSYLERGYKKYHKSYYDKNLKFESELFWRRVNTSVEAYHKYGMYLVKKEVSKYLDEEVEEVPEPEFIVKKVNIEVSEL